MTVEQLINELKEMNQDSVVVLTEPDGIGWTNIGKIFLDGCSVKITQDDTDLFN